MGGEREGEEEREGRGARKKATFSFWSSLPELFSFPLSHLK